MRVQKMLQKCGQELRHLRKAHSPRLPPRGLSFSRLSRACCGNCCRSVLPRLASHPVLFARYILLIRIVCSGHKGPRTSLSHRETKHLSALLCTTTDGEANAHVLSVVIQQLQNNGRASVTDLAFPHHALAFGPLVTKEAFGCSRLWPSAR